MCISNIICITKNFKKTEVLVIYINEFHCMFSLRKTFKLKITIVTQLCKLSKIREGKKTVRKCKIQGDISIFSNFIDNLILVDCLSKF